jgi:hypothetical protein
MSNPLKKMAASALMLLMVLMLMPLAGCGSDDAKNDGCPSDSYEANSTDIILGPADSSATVSNFPGGLATVSPLLYTITDKDGIPRNKVCMIFYTNGIFFTNNTYSVPFTGANVIGVTDGLGKITLYWGALLPPSNPVVGTTSGKDQTVDSWVQAYSGTLTSIFKYTWTVKGVQAP